MLSIKDPHTAIFSAPTNVGKTFLALNLLETEYKNHFDFIIIICPTLAYNKTYQTRKWVWTDDSVILINPGNQLYEWIEKLGKILAGWKTLFLIDDIISDENLDKKRQPLLQLAISGRHKMHSLWLLIQSYCAIPKNIRRQAKILYVWNPNNRTDWQLINDENDVIEQDKLNIVKNQLKQGKHTCLIIKIQFPREYQIIC